MAGRSRFCTEAAARVHRQIRPSCQSARAVSGKCVVRKAETEQVRETVRGKHRQTDRDSLTQQREGDRQTDRYIDTGIEAEGTGK